MIEMSRPMSTINVAGVESLDLLPRAQQDCVLAHLMAFSKQVKNIVHSSQIFLSCGCFRELK